MNELLLFGINEEEIKEINEKSNVLKEVTDKEIKDRINLLREINCEDKIIKNIIISNPDYLNRSVDDILKLIKKLLELNIERIDITFDKPFIYLIRDKNTGEVWFMGSVYEPKTK